MSQLREFVDAVDNATIRITMYECLERVPSLNAAQYSKIGQWRDNLQMQNASKIQFASWAQYRWVRANRQNEREYFQEVSILFSCEAPSVKIGVRHAINKIAPQLTD